MAVEGSNKKISNVEVVVVCPECKVRNKYINALIEKWKESIRVIGCFFILQEIITFYRTVSKGDG